MNYVNEMLRQQGDNIKKLRKIYDPKKYKSLLQSVT